MAQPVRVGPCAGDQLCLSSRTGVADLLGCERSGKGCARRFSTVVCDLRRSRGLRLGHRVVMWPTPF